MKRRDPDLSLLRRVAAGERAAVRELVAAKLPRVYRIALFALGDRGEAEDVAQEALLRAWRQAPRWSGDGPAAFDSWLHTVTANLCRDRLRKRREPLYAEAPERADPAPSALEQIEGAEASQRVRRALERLPPRQRSAILLFYYEELAVNDVATALDVSVEAAESLLSRGRRNLRILLDGAEP